MIEPRRIEKPWGYEIIWAHTDKYVGKILHINQGEQLSLQYHRKKDESVYILHGEMIIAVNGLGARMVAGMAIDIPRGTKHRMTALTDCDVLEASTPELDDVVRLVDRYGRIDEPSQS